MISNHKINFKNQKALIIALILIFIFPSWAVTANDFSDINNQSIKTNADLESLENIGVLPNLDLSSGWEIKENGNSDFIEFYLSNYDIGYNYKINLNDQIELNNTNLKFRENLLLRPDLKKTSFKFQSKSFTKKFVNLFVS